MKIAICISTRNRKEEYNNCLYHWVMALKNCPFEWEIFTVDDASEHIYCKSDHRFLFRSGIPKVKNKCIELAIESGANHIFLVDDDIYPLMGFDSIKHYIDSPHKLMCYTFYPGYISDGKYKYHIKGHGCLMYIHSDVVNTIGGFDTLFGLGKYEHTQYFERASVYGFVPEHTPFIDLLESKYLFYSMDEHKRIKRSFTDQEMDTLLNENKNHYYKTRYTTEYIPYK